MSTKQNIGWKRHLRAAAFVAAFASLPATEASAQWLTYPTPGIPRTPDGKPNLAAPTPRTSDGKPDLSGIWTGSGGGGYDRNIARDLKPADIQPWAETYYQKQVLNEGKDSPRAHCLPDPFVYYDLADMARIVQTPALIAVMYQGTTNSVHRTIFTDGRKLPVDPNPTWMGYSVGHWEGDTLVVDTAGFNDRNWLDLDGHPQTEALHITERFRRRDFGHMDLEITIDDPKAFTKPFSLKMARRLVPDTDLIESVCENDTSAPHSLGGTGTKLAPEVLSKYTGTYEFAPGSPAVITLAGDLLFLQLGADPVKHPLAPDSETVFISRTGDLIEFIRDAQGAVTGFIFQEGGYHGSGKKRKAIRTR
jgi:hypothetical protein